MARLRPLTPKRNFQSPSDPMVMLAETHEKDLTRELKAALKHLRTIIPIDKIEAAMKSGRATKVIEAIPFDHFEEVLKTPMSVLGRIYEEAGTWGAKKLARKMARGGVKLRYKPSHFRKDAGDGFDFDRFDPETQRRLRAILAELIGDLSDQAKATISAVVVEGLRAGDDFSAIASNIRDTITLTPNQATHVSSYRRGLENLDSNVLTRALRDTDLDSYIREAIVAREALPSEMIDEAVDAYLENYLDYRSSTISRTESLRAANTGLHDSYQQAVERGAIPEGAVKRVWLLDLDERTCDVCKSIVDNAPDGVGLNDSFRSDDGEVDNPPVHPNCRCTVQYETDLDKIPD